MENLRELVIEQLEEMNYDDIVEVHNLYCSLIDDYGAIEENGEEGLRILLGDGEGYLSLAYKIFNGGYNPYHDYVKLGGDANLESFNDPTDHIYISDMVNTIMENLKEFEHLLELEY